MGRTRKLSKLTLHSCITVTDNIKISEVKKSIAQQLALLES